MDPATAGVITTSASGFVDANVAGFFALVTADGVGTEPAAAATGAVTEGAVEATAVAGVTTDAAGVAVAVEEAVAAAAGVDVAVVMAVAVGVVEPVAVDVAVAVAGTGACFGCADAMK